LPDNYQTCGLHLLSLAKTIRYYEEALTQASGERFNLFDILHVGHYEVRTHSPMLADLLDRQGSHGQGSVFLKRFLTELEIDDFDAEWAKVDTEFSIGELGRLDIKITDRNRRSIYIENKINARLQENQLERYHKDNPEANLLFLTLNGEVPPDWSANPAYKTESFKKVFKTVSYKVNIVRWLGCCRKEAATAPGVRESITQYIHLIQRLTQQNTSTRMNQEIIKAVTQDKETYLAYANLRNADWEIRKVIIAKLQEQLHSIAQELGLEILEKLSGHGEKEEECLFTTPDLKAQNLEFGFGCERSNYGDCYFGFAHINLDQESPLQAQIQSLFKAKFRAEQPNKKWPASAYWKERPNWDDETMAAILSGDFAKDLKVLIASLSEIATKAVAFN
jgi:hypothetical protein